MMTQMSFDKIVVDCIYNPDELIVNNDELNIMTLTEFLRQRNYDLFSKIKCISIDCGDDDVKREHDIYTFNVLENTKMVVVICEKGSYHVTGAAIF